MWEPVDARFYVKRHPVDIVNIGGVGNDGRLTRALFEALYAVTQLHLCGTPGDFLQVISQGQDAAPHMLICGHGDDNGLVFGEFGPGIDASMLVEGSMPPECIAENIHLPGCVVINGGCACGEKAMAEAFMSGNLKAYMGTVDPVPEHRADLMFLVHFFYKLFRTGCSEREAWEQAASYDSESRLWVFWDEDGCHRLTD